MVQDATAAEHPAGGQDHGRSRHLVQGLRVGYVSNEVGFAAAQRAGVPVHQQVDVQVVVITEAAVDLAGVDRHRAVDIDGKVGGEARLLELADVVEDLLGSAAGEG